MKIINWLVLSSKDSTATSVTVKAFLTALVTTITILAGFVHVQLPTADLTAIVDLGIAIVQGTLLVVSSITTLIALGRKIYRTFKGTNAVLNDPTVSA